MRIVSYLKNRKVSNKRKIEKIFHIKYLGSIPLNNKQSNFMIANNSKTDIMEQIKNIRTNVFKLTDKNVISIISCNQREGKSVVANNLAISMARINKRVLLIDTNLREESNKSEIFYAEKGEGLSNFIRDLEINDKVGNLNKCKKYIKKTQIPNLYILPSGTITASSAELIKNKKMNELVNLCKEIFDYILIDGTSILENSDWINISKIADTNILVIEKCRTKYKDLLDAKNEIELNNCNILGFILNKTKNKKDYKKKYRQNLGIYMETTNEETNREVLLENIIDKIISEIESEKSKDFEGLHKEIKDTIMIDDFINDIETNFNMKFDNIEKENNENKETFLNEIYEIKTKMSEEIEKYNYRRNKENKLYEKLYKKTIKKHKVIEEEIKQIKSNQEMFLNYFEQVIEEIKNKNFDGRFNEIYEKIESLEKSKSIEKNEELNNTDNIEKKSNIINLKKLFTQNRKKNNKSFSIDEPIPYEDLEKLAVDVVYFNDEEDFNNIDKIAKKI